MPPSVLALVLVVGLLTLIPARRLHVGGWSGGTVATWYAALCLLSMLVVGVPGRTRFLVPVILIGWILPFIVPRSAVDRFLRRRADRRAPPATGGADRDARG